MSDRPPSMLDRYVGRPAGPDPTTSPEEGETEAFGCFGMLRGARERAVSLELRRRTGEVLAIPYGYIAKLEFSPSGGILICCGSETVRIRGRNLNREIRPRVTLFGGLARHAVLWVCESDRAAALVTGNDAAIVECIEWIGATG